MGEERKPRRMERDGRRRRDEMRRRGKLKRDRRRRRNLKRDRTRRSRDEPRERKDSKKRSREEAGPGGGVYIPPFKWARTMEEIDDKTSAEYQRLIWDALRKSINGLINKVNATNIKSIIPELFTENLIWGRGLFCRSCIKSQMASPRFTEVYAALVAVVNTKFPEIGHLLLARIILRFKRAYKRNDKPQLLAAIKFIAHLVNQQVAHDLLALELLTVLLEQPTDDSVQVAVDFVKQCGSILQHICPKGLHAIFERFRGILHEGEIDKRVQFLFEALFAIRKANFQGHPAVRPELDLVDPEDQLTHQVSLDDEIDPQISLDIFRNDPNFLENETRYEELKKSIIGVGEEESVDEDGSEFDDDEEQEDVEQMEIKDATETNLINL